MTVASLPTLSPREAEQRARNIDAQALADELQSRLRGEVRFDDGSRALYATDASNYRQVPIGVVLPKDAEDVMEAVAICRRHGSPILGRGGGTSLAGQCCNAAVVFDFSKYMHRVRRIDPEAKLAEVDPGVYLDQLQQAAAPYQLMFGPDPATHSHCALGGMIGNNSCGVHSVIAGKTDDNVETLDVLLYDGTRMSVGKVGDEAALQAVIDGGGRRGEIYAALRSLRDRYGDRIRQRFPHIPRRVSGYNLDRLLPEHGFDVAKVLVGSESTCVLVLGATVRLVWNPPHRVVLALGYPDVFSAADHAQQVLAAGPMGLEGMDDRLIDDMKRIKLHPQRLQLLPDGRGWLLVEFGGHTAKEAEAQARRLMDELQQQPHPPSMRLYLERAQQQMLWKVRESGLGATAHVPGRPVTWEGWEDSAVPPDQLGTYLRQLRALFDKYQYEGALYGHFGQGCVHTRIDFDLETVQGVERFRAFVEEAADLVVALGGSFSGEHGDGQSRAELLPKMYGEEIITAFEEFKAIWDPQGKMNPGKIVRPYRLDENLRVLNFRPPQTKTWFQYAGDGGDFRRVNLRCVGVGECRSLKGRTMCPSYRVTREEKHSTRGRARLLYEMLEGDPLHGGWQSEEVKDALDLCLACKGCKSDCPVQVDMATYKAEFLAHYYQGRLRPRQAYTMGLVQYWARLASIAPEIANFLAQAPGLSAVAKWIGGISPQREVPRFARQTFRAWFRRRGPRNPGRPQVLLWPDTFNNYLHPQVGIAAVEVLEAAGYQVILPQQHLCCGRPLYDYGFLDLARHRLNQIVDALRPQIQAGIPLVGLEPSCLAVFRDELRNLLGDEGDAKRLAENAFMFGEFLAEKADGYQPPRLHGRAIVHGHCHRKALGGMDHEEQVLAQVGLNHTLLDSGCCGMAGSFGFEDRHYRVSQDVGELVLLPAVREVPKTALIVADGFSCQEQIQQNTDRRALHLAEVLHAGLRGGPEALRGEYPERQYLRKFAEPGPRRPSAGTLALAGATVLAAGSLLAWGLSQWAGARPTRVSSR